MKRKEKKNSRVVKFRIITWAFMEDL